MMEVTGMLHCRVQGPSKKSGREETHVLVAVVGILSVPKGVVETNQLLGVAGGAEVESPGYMHGICTKPAGTFDATGMSHGSVLMEPIWRV